LVKAARSSSGVAKVEWLKPNEATTVSTIVRIILLFSVATDSLNV
jgi:hypothetical protein